MKPTSDEVTSLSYTTRLHVRLNKNLCLLTVQKTRRRTDRTIGVRIPTRIKGILLWSVTGVEEEDLRP